MNEKPAPISDAARRLLDAFDPVAPDSAWEAAAEAAARRQAADARATACLAAMQCPADLVEFGRRHGIPTFAQATWQAGFIAGWRAANPESPAECPACGAPIEDSRL